ncbi:MAG: META domain-containing protein [Gemmatimonadales bacterium]
MNRIGVVALAGLASMAGLVACQAAGDDPSDKNPAEEAALAVGPPTLEELENATYQGFEDPASVTLTDGSWTGEPYAEDADSRPEITLVRRFRTTGDLDRDNQDEAITLLNLASGGAGQFLYLAVVDRRDGRPVNVATQLIGDRVQVRRVRIEGPTVYLDVVQAGPEDAACCPGELATLGWELLPEGGMKVIGVTEEPGRLSLETIGDTRWVLREWSLGETAPEEPAVTLRYDDERFTGTSGCNQYFAAVTLGEMPGEVSVGRIGSTRMACPEPETAVETRFLSLLERVNTYGFMAGDLMLGYSTDDGSGAMIFERRVR